MKLLFRGKPNVLSLSRKLAEQYGIVTGIKWVKIGSSWKMEMDVTIDEELTDDTMYLPEDLKNIFTIPEELDYELKVDNSSIAIGPIIAMVAYRRKRRMTLRRINKMKNRFSDYECIRGLLFVCAADGINVKDKTIEGYYYNPKGSTHWEFGKFPYPDALYKRRPIDETRNQDLIRELGERLINGNYFLKADVAEVCESDETFASYFPHSEMLRDSQQLIDLVNRFQSVYIKPDNGSQGIGIYKVTMDEKQSLIFKDRRKRMMSFETTEEFEGFLNKCKRKKYIVQKAIESPNKKRHGDFRVYAQKDGSKQWVCQGMIGRLAKEGTIISNLKFVEKLYPGEEGIQTLFGVDVEEARIIQNRIYEQCIGVCQELDKRFGNFGDVAVDVIVDGHHTPWILEINKVYGYNSIRKMGNKQLLERLLTTPFVYAKALAGF